MTIEQRVAKLDRSKQTLLLERNSVLDGFRDVSQTAGAAWVGLFAPAFSGLGALLDDSLDIGLASTTNVVAYRLAVIAEAIA